MTSNATSIYISKLLSNLIGVLTGIFLSSCAAFRAEWFFEYNIYVGYLHSLFVFVGCILVFYFGARIAMFKGRYGLLSLVGIELTLIIFFFIVTQFQIKKKIPGTLLGKIYYSLIDTIQYNVTFSQYDSELGYIYRPNVSSKFQKWEFSTYFQTNKAGLRDDDASLNNPAIIALGDSYGSGWGVGQQETYAQLVEKYIGKKVLNAGIASYGTVREGLLLNRLDRDSCQWVIIQYCVNDFQENRTWADSVLRGQIFSYSNTRKSYKTNVLANTVRNTYVPFRFFFESGREVIKNLFYSEKETFRNTSSIPLQANAFLRTLTSIRKTYQGKILVVSISSSKRLDAPFIAESKRLSSGYGLLGVYFLDTSTKLGLADIYTVDRHLNKSGHQKIAAQIIKFLQSSPRIQDKNTN